MTPIEPKTIDKEIDKGNFSPNVSLSSSSIISLHVHSRPLVFTVARVCLQLTLVKKILNVRISSAGKKAFLELIAQYSI
jgi:hypothetical protein